jgi:capsular exopolysaccharide synthesis family protein
MMASGPVPVPNDAGNLALTRPAAGYVSAPVRLSEPVAGLQLRDVGRMLGRRRLLIAVLLLLLNGFAFWSLSHIKPRYTAEASVLINPRQQQIVDLKAVLAGLGGESDVIESEIQVIKSREIARVLVNQFDLDKNPEFNPVLAPEGTTVLIKSFIMGQVEQLLARLPFQLRAYLPHPAADAAPDPALSHRDPLSGTVDAFLRRLWVAPRGHSRVIAISFESSNPLLASTIANAVADAYIANQVREKSEATVEAHRWLSARVAELREQVLNADAAVVAYQRRTGLTEGRLGSLISEQITALSDQLIKAQAAEAETQSRLRAAEAGGSHAYGLQVMFNAARDRTQTLQTELMALRQQLNNGNESEIELHALQHDADADRALYDRLLARLKETSIEAGLQTPDAQVISRAEPPESPTFPKKGLILPIIFVATLVIVSLLVVALESMDQGFSSLEQLERLLGVPAVGAMPTVRRRFGRSPEPEMAVLHQPMSLLSESLRGLYTSLVLSSLEQPPKVILMASSLPREGKTSTLIALARMLAMSGKRVLIIDTDLRRGRLHRVCGVDRRPGLLDALIGKVTIAEAMTQDKHSPVCVLTTGSTSGVSPDILGSQQMRSFLTTLGETFDVILLDSAPLLAVADTRNLCRLADRIILLVRWRDTRRDAVAAGVRQIIEAGGLLAGCVLTLVDQKRYCRYGDRGFFAQRGGLYIADH